LGKKDGRHQERQPIRKKKMESGLKRNRESAKERKMTVGKCIARDLSPA